MIAASRHPAGPPKECPQLAGSSSKRLLRLGLRLAQADNLVARLELPALLKQFDALETLQDVALCADGAGAFETAVLRHKSGSCFWKRDAECIARIALRNCFLTVARILTALLS